MPRLGNSTPSGPRMTITLAPPGNTLSSAEGVVHGNGANHCLSSAGSVHARYTFSRGASMVRVRMRSRPSVVVVIGVLLSNLVVRLLQPVDAEPGHLHHRPQR